MPFFHASRSIYHEGHVIRVPERNTSYSYQHALAIGSKWREDALEAARRGRACSRQFAVYAANTCGNAAKFLNSQPNPENLPVKVYEVTVSNKSPSPMVLIGFMDDHGQAFPALAECMEEYWHPTRDWQFLEYVCSEMTIRRCLGNLDQKEMYRAGADYDHDRELAVQVWGIPPRNKPA